MAADQISKLTEEIQTTVEDAVTHMNISVREVQLNVDVVSEASATFEKLYEKVGETNNRVKQMIELVNQVDVISKEMEEISKSQADAAEQIAQSAEGLNQQTKNVTSNSYMVTEGAETLEKESEKLMNKIGKFKI